MNMKQDINFLEGLSKAPLQLPTTWIMGLLLAMVGLLMLISLGMGITQIKDAWQLKQAHNQYMETLKVFKKMAKSQPLLASDTPLDEQVAYLNATLDTKKIAYATLTRSALQDGFSNYLVALAEVVPEGLWLNEMNINLVTRQVTLGGYMLQPVNVSLLLKALQQKAPFSSTTFDLFYIKALPEQSYVAFKITNKQGGLAP